MLRKCVGNHPFPLKKHYFCVSAFKRIAELKIAHRANNAAVLEAYGFPKGATEVEIVARYFKMH